MTSAATGLDEEVGRLLRGDPEVLADPYPLLRELRGRGRVYDAGSLLLVTRYDDVKRIYSDDRNFSKRVRFGGSAALEARALLAGPAREQAEEVDRFASLFLTSLDGADHERVREVAHRAFTPRRIAALQASMHEHAARALEPLLEDDVVDLMAFAYEMPLTLLLEMLGVPQSDRGLIHRWSQTLIAHLGNVTGSAPELVGEALRVKREFCDYLQSMLDDRDRRDAAEGDLLTDLLGAEDDGRMSTEELTAMFVVLLITGHETTTSLIANGMVELLRRRDQWRLLCADPALVPEATEELLRFVSPVFGNSKVVMEDGFEVAGRRCDAGTTVFPLAASANRDPAVFADPETLDLRRADAKRHIAFGFGERYCIGNQLARHEAATAFATLARRFPDLELAAGELEYHGTVMLRRPRELPVRLGRDRGT